MKPLLFLLPVVFLLCACSSPTDNNDEPFSLNITLQDANGNPLQGYKLCIAPENFMDWFYSRPCATIPFYLQSDYHVHLEAQDYFGKPLRTLIDDTLPAGHHCIVWNSQDSLGNYIDIDGLYKFRIEYFTDEQSVFCDSTYGYLFGAGMNSAVTTYVTDEYGNCAIDYMLPFPCLYCTKEVEQISCDGEDIGSIEFVSSFKLLACSPDSNGVSKYTYFNIHRGENNLMLNFDAMEEGLEDRGAISAAIPQGTPLGSEDDTDPAYNRLGPVYPNPFN